MSTPDSERKVPTAAEGKEDAVADLEASEHDDVKGKAKKGGPAPALRLKARTGD